MTRYAKHVSRVQTPQDEQAREDQVVNNAGGYVFKLSPWAALDRFLILGTAGGSYYCTERKMTKDSVRFLDACLAEDFKRTVDRIVEVSDSGRAPKNDPAIFCLAYAASTGSVEGQAYALAQLRKVCRIGTHLFMFLDSIEQFRGWGRALRRAVASWYTTRTADEVAQQAMKYAQRGGRSHRDILRQSHADAPSPEHLSIFRWIARGSDSLGDMHVERKDKPVHDYKAVGELPERVKAFEILKKSDNAIACMKLIREHDFSHEMVPTEGTLRNSPEVWAALLEKMPMTAMIRNLAKMTAVGLLQQPWSKASQSVVERLGNQEALRKARVHPISVLMALLTYKSGHGQRGKLTWTPNTAIVDALDSAFYLAFQSVEPTGKRRLVALDISGSMGTGEIAGCVGLTPRLATAALAMVTVKTEKWTQVVGFTNDPRRKSRWTGYGSGLTPIDLSKSVRLDDAVAKVSNLPMGGTDCALPMIWAKEQKLTVDSFEVYTDNETWAGDIHPFQALKEYRKFSGIESKLVVNGMTATEFTIADSSDPNMLDVIGFDAAAPAVMAEFIRG